MGNIKQAFEQRVVAIPVDCILPTRMLPKAKETSKKYLTILCSIRELGIIEPLAVHPQPVQQNGSTLYILLDGHMRLAALKALGATEALCLIATDDEGFTYNRQVSRLTPIQEHKMILAALKKGVDPKRIAQVLGIHVERIHARKNLLKGIAPEVSEMLKVRMVAHSVFNVLRQMKPIRQIQAAEMMISANCYSLSYARMVLAATRPEFLIEQKKPIAEITPVDIARMEREMENLQHDYRLVEDSLGETMLSLVVAKGYLMRLLRNEPIAIYLHQHHADLLEELVSIMEAVSSDARHLERE
ncbi:plasmid partitioning protein RepB C-terminal domain-containing protein [Pseudomonas nitroreducens]|uniref:plasmid partitioning protein RepB C-terminal domain-containing protein n=1 Tax=Pseudomonas nitroreducens TaxID=46680 RepID=UPI0020A220E7|nr:plasmid partitioning protein RepB C-terminal domain-containing protein [Pseudomonas nitroreducens]MCP1621525.1 hypothetical protein [Pseudomonas nitroreducens]